MNGLHSLTPSQYQDQDKAKADARPIPTRLKGRDLFNSSVWQNESSTATFYQSISTLRRKIHDEVKETSTTHKFIRHLRDQKKLVRCYTQNIDGLEDREGLCSDLARGAGNKSRFTKKAIAKPNVPTRCVTGGERDGGCEVVQLHGDLDLLRCRLCQRTSSWSGNETGEDALLHGQAPNCEDCSAINQDRQDRGKRGTRIGTLRPNIILYGEQHPSVDQVSSIIGHDLKMVPDVLLIFGTSLQVHGFRKLVRDFAKVVHAKPNSKGRIVFVNLTKPSASIWNGVLDYWVSMDCDKWVEDLRRRKPELWQVQTEIRLQKTKKANVLYDASVEKKKKKIPAKIKGIMYEQESFQAILPASDNKENECDVIRVAQDPLQYLDEKGRQLSRSPPPAFEQKRRRAPLRPQKFRFSPSIVRQQTNWKNCSEPMQFQVAELSSVGPISKRRKTDVTIWEDPVVMLSSNTPVQSMTLHHSNTSKVNSNPISSISETQSSNSLVETSFVREDAIETSRKRKR